MFKQEKIKFASNVVTKVKDRIGLILCRHEQLSANELAQIRLSIRRAGSLMQIGRKGVLRKGFQNAENEGVLPFKFSKTLDGIKGPTAWIFFNEDILGTLASLNDSAKKYPGQIEIISAQMKESLLTKEDIKGMSKYRGTPELFQGLYTVLTTPISALVIFLKEYYKQILEEGTKMITKNEIESIIGEEQVSKEAKELATATLQLSQGDLYSMLNLIQKVMKEKFDFSLGSVSVGSSSGQAAASEQPEEKKDFKLKVVNVDAADKLKAAKMVQELFEKGGKPIAKLIEASKMLAVGVVFDLNPLPGDEAQSWVDKFAELGVVMEKI